jgi:hypothetical protein
MEQGIKSDTDRALASCTTALRTFANRQFINWAGLPPSCSLEEVTQHFPLLNDGVGLARLGRKKRQFRMLVVQGYDHPVRIWLDGPRVLMLDVQYPTFSSEVPVVLKELGEPEAKLDYDWGTLPIERGEWVYPNRGLTLFMTSNNLSVLHLAVFLRTTMQTYEENFRLHLGKKPFPRR